MEQTRINKKMNSLYLQTTLCIEKLNDIFVSYVKNFKADDFYTFSDEEQRLKSYKSYYSSLIVDMAPLFAELGEISSKISELLITADRCTSSYAESLERVFNSFLRLDSVYLSFTKSTDKLLHTQSATASAWVYEAEKMLSAISTLKDALK